MALLRFDSRGAHAGERGPLWSGRRYLARPWRWYAELAMLTGCSLLAPVLAVADGREVAAWIGAVGLCCVVVSPGLRVPLGVPVALAGLVTAYEAALVGRFDAVQAAIFLGTGLMAVLAISVLGFTDEADRRRTWGEPRRMLPVEPGPLVGWPNLRSRRRKHVVDGGGFVAVGVLCAAYGLHQGDAWRGWVAVAGVVAVALSPLLRAPAWPLLCWVGVTVSLAGAVASAAPISVAGVALLSIVLFFVVHDAAWSGVEPAR